MGRAAPAQIAQHEGKRTSPYRERLSMCSANLLESETGILIAFDTMT